MTLESFPHLKFPDALILRPPPCFPRETYGVTMADKHSMTVEPDAAESHSSALTGRVTWTGGPSFVGLGLLPVRWGQ